MKYIGWISSEKRHNWESVYYGPSIQDAKLEIRNIALSETWQKWYGEKAIGRITTNAKQRVIEEFEV